MRFPLRRLLRPLGPCPAAQWARGVTTSDQPPPSRVDGVEYHRDGMSNVTPTILSKVAPLRRAARATPPTLQRRLGGGCTTSRTIR